jgi:hypothetical protein
MKTDWHFVVAVHRAWRTLVDKEKKKKRKLKIK